MVISPIASTWFAMQRGSCLHWCTSNLRLFVSNLPLALSFRSLLFALCALNLSHCSPIAAPCSCFLFSPLFFALQNAVQGWVTMEQRHLGVRRPVMKPTRCWKSLLYAAFCAVVSEIGDKKCLLPVLWSRLATSLLPIHLRGENKDLCIRTKTPGVDMLKLIGRHPAIEWPYRHAMVKHIEIWVLLFLSESNLAGDA